VPDGAAEELDEALKGLDTSVIEEYAEFVPPGGPRSAIKDLYAGKPALVGGASGPKAMYAMGAEFV
jgi:xanthine dehydrogenase YagR molybdenum-binding subunit